MRFDRHIALTNSKYKSCTYSNIISKYWWIRKATVLFFTYMMVTDLVWCRLITYLPFPSVTHLPGCSSLAIRTSKALPCIFFAKHNNQYEQKCVWIMCKNIFYKDIYQIVDGFKNECVQCNASYKAVSFTIFFKILQWYGRNSFYVSEHKNIIIQKILISIYCHLICMYIRGHAKSYVRIKINTIVYMIWNIFF